MVRMKTARTISATTAVVAVLALTDCRDATVQQSGRTEATSPPALAQVVLKPDDRILVLAPHPDDEVLGCAGIIQSVAEMRLPIRVVFFTYGDNNEWSFLVYRKHPVLFPRAVQAMGQIRHHEALAAANVLGLSPDQLTFLGYPDFGTLAIWYEHWGAQPPHVAMLTRARAVPYANAFRPGAPYKGEEILRDLTTVLREFRPTKVFVSHPADHNGDHAALYLFTRVALWDLQGELSPELYPYLIHLTHWPQPRGLAPAESLRPAAVLGQQTSWITHGLSAEQVARKQTALQNHRSQYASSKDYLSSFVRANELFGDFVSLPLYYGLVHERVLQKAGGDAGPPEELSAEECAAFCAIDWNFIRLQGQDLVVSVRLSRPLPESVVASLYAFGYRHDRPFADMPKIRVSLGARTHVALNLSRKLAPDEVALTHEADLVTLRLPLATLGNPDRILLSARTHRGEVPLDWVAWRVLELTRNPSTQVSATR